jgi:hypothetical protein
MERGSYVWFTPIASVRRAVWVSFRVWQGTVGRERFGL